MPPPPTEREEYASGLRRQAAQALLTGYCASAPVAALSPLALMYQPGDLLRLLTPAGLKYWVVLVVACAVWYFVYQGLAAWVLPQLRAYVLRILVDHDLLLKVMADDAYQRYPRLGLDPDPWEIPIRWRRPRLDSFRQRMRDLLVSWAYLARLEGCRPVPSAMGAAVIVAAVPLIALAGWDVYLHLLNRREHWDYWVQLFKNGLAASWAGWFTGLLAIPASAVAITISALASAGDRLALADALEGYFAEDEVPADDPAQEVKVYEASDAEYADWVEAEERKRHRGPFDPPDTGWG